MANGFSLPIALQWRVEHPDAPERARLQIAKLREEATRASRIAIRGMVERLDDAVLSMKKTAKAAREGRVDLSNLNERAMFLSSQLWTISPRVAKLRRELIRQSESSKINFERLTDLANQTMTASGSSEALKQALSSIRDELEVLKDKTVLQEEAFRDLNGVQFGLMKQTYDTAMALKMSQSMAHGAMLGFGALNGSILQVMFSVIFLQFSMAKVALTIAGLVVSVGGLTKAFIALHRRMVHVAMSLEQFGIRARYIYRDVREGVAAITTVDRAVMHWGFSVDQVTEGIWTLRKANIYTAETLAAVALIAKATTDDFAKTAADVVRSLEGEELKIEGVEKAVIDLYGSQWKLMSQTERLAAIVRMASEQYSGSTSIMNMSTKSLITAIKGAGDAIFRALGEPFLRDVVKPLLRIALTVMTAIAELAIKFRESSVIVQRFVVGAFLAFAVVLSTFVVTAIISVFRAVIMTRPEFWHLYKAIIANAKAFMKNFIPSIMGTVKSTKAMQAAMKQAQVSSTSLTRRLIGVNSAARNASVGMRLLTTAAYGLGTAFKAIAPIALIMLLSELPALLDNTLGKSEKVKMGMEGIAQAMIWGGIAAAASTKGLSLIATALGVILYIAAQFPGAVETIGKLFEAETWERWGRVISTTFRTWVVEPLSDIYQLMVDWFRTRFAAFFTERIPRFFIEDLPRILAEVGKSLLSAIGEPIVQAFDAAKRWVSERWESFKQWLSSITILGWRPFSGLATAGATAHGTPRGMQKGGVVLTPTTVRVAEAGPEAIIPLRPGFGLGGGGITIMVTGNYVLNESMARTLADEVADQLMRTLRRYRGAATVV